jgi:hypothetical protein
MIMYACEKSPTPCELFEFELLNFSQLKFSLVDSIVGK